MRTTLTTRRLGATDMEITTVGFGAWAIGGGDWVFGWGPQDDAQSIATIRHATERGINWIDTAAVYGLGHSEEIVRQALEEIPAAERPYVFTKGGLVWDERDRMASPKQVLRPESIRRECEASLRRLGVERIDLYQFHWPDETGIAVEDSWAEMARLVDQGKVRAAGVSNFDASLLERCEALHHVDSLQPPFSIIRRQAAEREIPWCAAHGTGVIVYSPMQSGLLTDRFSEERVRTLAEDDWRRRSSELQSAQALPQSRAARRAPADRRSPRRHGRRNRDRVDPRVDRRHGRDRGRAHAGAGGRLDRRRLHRADPGRSGGDRERCPEHRRRVRSGAARVTAWASIT
jgi:aryl-alcohol dehydrogenase-like predicted oxidoreductase